MSKIERHNRAEQQAPAMAESDRFNAAAKLARTRIADGVATPSERQFIDGLDGAKAGKVQREREQAAEHRDLLRAVAKSRPLSAAEAEALSAAEEVLREAEEAAQRSGRNVGRWTALDRDRIPAETLVKMARGATAAELARAARTGYRLDRERRADALEDHSATAVAEALEQHSRHGAMPRWDALSADVEEGTLDRDAWAAWLRRAARRALDAQIRREQAEQAEGEQDAGEQREERTAERTADAAALVEQLSARLLRPLGKMETAGAMAALDGLTHRERAERDDESPAVAKDRAKRGRQALGKRWESAEALRAEIRAAAAAAQRADFYRAALRLDPMGPVADPERAEERRAAVLALESAADAQRAIVNVQRERADRAADAGPYRRDGLLVLSMAQRARAQRRDRIAQRNRAAVRRASCAEPVDRATYRGFTGEPDAPRDRTPHRIDGAAWLSSALRWQESAAYRPSWKDSRMIDRAERESARAWAMVGTALARLSY